MTSVETTIADGWTVCDLKENAWHKNERAHQKLRAKKDKNRPLCGVCLNRTCNSIDCAPILQGHKSFKKSKIIMYHHTKIYNGCHIDTEFVDWRGGESMEHVIPSPMKDENLSPEALESPERLD
jgi:hypothetical protein